MDHCTDVVFCPRHPSQNQRRRNYRFPPHPPKNTPWKSLLRKEVLEVRNGSPEPPEGFQEGQSIEGLLGTHTPQVLPSHPHYLLWRTRLCGELALVCVGWEADRESRRESRRERTLSTQVNKDYSEKSQRARNWLRVTQVRSGRDGMGRVSSP